MNLDRITAVTTKNLRQWSRDEQALTGPMLIPLVLMFLCGVLFGFGGDEWNIALVNRGTGPHATAFETQVRDLRGNISPYFHVVTTDPAEADRLVTEGRLHMVLTIPDDFDQVIEAGDVPTLETQVSNINTDMMKNARLRLDRVIQDYAATHVEGRRRSPSPKPPPAPTTYGAEPSSPTAPSSSPSWSGPRSMRRSWSPANGNTEPPKRSDSRHGRWPT